MVLELYYDLLSEPSRAVYLFLKATGIPFESKVVSLIKCEYNNADFMKKNPWKKIPVIEDDGFILSESVAILRYIAVKYNVAEHWYPRNDVQKTARIDEFLNWHHHNLRRPVSDYWGAILLNRIGVNENYPKTPLNEERSNRTKQEATESINHLADYYIEEQHFIGGDDISVADLIAFCHLVYLGVVNEESLYKSHPKVSAYVRRIEERLKPHYEETCEPYTELRRRFIDGQSYI